jgi:uncharacterized lipoprotein YddW (UPF0748 family)
MASLKTLRIATGLLLAAALGVTQTLLPLWAARESTYQERLQNYRHWLLNQADVSTSNAMLSQPTPSQVKQSALTRLQQTEEWLSNLPEEGTASSALMEKVNQSFLEGALALFPSAKAETRAIWLDRIAILKAGSPEGIDKLIGQLAEAGFNCVFFEAVNGGYAFFKSTFYAPYPLAKQWDPLQAVITSAKARNMQVHAWVWAMAVGNRRLHNRLPNWHKPHPVTPLLTVHPEQTKVLGSSGLLLDPTRQAALTSDQSEIWLDPASPNTARFVKLALEELVTHYGVDGVQLDYIRYPFQPTSHPLGQGSESLRYYLSERPSPAPKEIPQWDWALWKVQRLNSLVEDLSTHLRRVRPGLLLSAAVYPTERRGRLQSIHQDWETWLRRGWIHTLHPMVYPEDLETYEATLLRLKAMMPASNKTYWIYPGTPAHKMSDLSTLQAIQLARRHGFYGYTVFSVSHVHPNFFRLLRHGPNRHPVAMLPHRDTLECLRQIIAHHQTFLSPDVKRLLPPLATLLKEPYSLDTVQHLEQQLEKNLRTNTLRKSRRDLVFLQQVQQLLGWLHSYEGFHFSGSPGGSSTVTISHQQ